jgi:hypothetical protein
VSSDDGDDVVGQGEDHAGSRFSLPPWRLSRGSLILAALTLLIGLGAGYAAGQRHTGGPARAGARAAGAGAAGAGGAATRQPRTSPSPVSPLVPVSLALTQLATGCSAQVGRDLQLGVQVTNRSAAPVTLGEVKAVLPMGGLRAISQQWGPCGALPAGQAPPGSPLAPGDSVWFTVTFKVLLKCPGPLPVQFAVGYDVGGRHAVATLPGFADLTQVPYGVCPG